MKKAALHNLGCKVNAYETEAMQQRLRESGYTIVPFAEEADVYIINTCTVTNIADRKSRQMLHRAKKRNPNAIVVAAGCYVQTAKEICEADESVDIIIGNNRKKDIIQILEEFQAKKKKTDTVIDINHTAEYEDMPVTQMENHTRAYIKIQDGCNQFCTYCVIPYARGRVRSREKESIKMEVRNLAKAGFKEIVLTGIHLSSYGIDRGETGALLSLMEQLHKIAGIERIHLGSLEPKIITREFVERISSLPKICPHFHLSLQSGSDTVLKRMNRRYTSAEYEEGCQILRKYYKNPAITTDIITGFPGETEEEFQETYAFAKRIAFFDMHIFKYSRREGTKAAWMEHQIPEQIKTERSDQLLLLAEKLSEEYRKWFIGQEMEILIEETEAIEGEEYQVGHTSEYIKVAVKARENLCGRIIKVYLKEIMQEKHEILYGELLS